MPRLSKLLEKLEDRLADRWDRWYDRHKSKLCFIFRWLWQAGISTGCFSIL